MVKQEHHLDLDFAVLEDVVVVEHQQNIARVGANATSPRAVKPCRPQ